MYEPSLSFFSSYRFLGRQRIGSVKVQAKLKCNARGYYTTPCGGMWISFGHGQPSAEIAQVGHPNMWQNANLVGPGAAPSHEMRVNRQKLV